MAAELGESELLPRVCDGRWGSVEESIAEALQVGERFINDVTNQLLGSMSALPIVDVRRPSHIRSTSASLPQAATECGQNGQR